MVRGPNCLAQPVRHRFEHNITDRMAVSIIDLLELIAIDQHRVQPLSIALAAAGLDFEGVLKPATVEHPGEWIGRHHRHQVSIGHRELFSRLPGFVDQRLYR